MFVSCNRHCLKGVKKNKAKDNYPTISSRGGCSLTNERIRNKAELDHFELVTDLRRNDETIEVPEYVPPDITRADTWLGNRQRLDGSYSSDEVRKIAELMVMIDHR